MSQLVHKYEFTEPWETTSRSYVRIWTPSIPTLEGKCHVRFEAQILSRLGRSTVQLGQETPPNVLRQWSDLMGGQWLSHDWDIEFKGDGEFYRLGVNARTDQLQVLNAEPNFRIIWMTLVLTFANGGKVVEPPPPEVEVEAPYRRNIIL